MSKQDGYAPRTPADLERKYNFGQTFAEVYGLVADAQRAAEDAQNSADDANNAYNDLDQEQIFKLLTNDGAVQGLFMGEDKNMYFNASYIKGGMVKAEYLDAENLKVKSANITDKITADKIDATGLEVESANIKGTLTAEQIDATGLKVDGANITGTINAASFTSKGTEEWQETKVEGGKIAFKSGCMYDGQSGVLYFDADKLRFDAEQMDFILTLDPDDPSNTRIMRLSPEYGFITVDGNDDIKQYVVFSKTFNELKARVEAIEAKLGM